ncbi:MAG TPA: organic hydroperoxide resistance protein [Actinomycetales bacterium]|nr:organic hydroperoxide resistance protein [Actinomycetales bacterium]
MTLQPDIKYTASATAQGGREGHVRSSDGLIDMDMRPPAELGGPGGAANPELLFAAGYSACFQGALGLAGKAAGVDTSNSVVTAHVGIGPEGESFALAVTIEVTIPGQDEESTKRLTERAHELCPYSKATRGNVEVTLRPQTV